MLFLDGILRCLSFGLVYLNCVYYRHNQFIIYKHSRLGLFNALALNFQKLFCNLPLEVILGSQLCIKQVTVGINLQHKIEKHYNPINYLAKHLTNLFCLYIVKHNHKSSLKLLSDDHHNIFINVMLLKSKRFFRQHILINARLTLSFYFRKINDLISFLFIN